jgi:uncharacterized membrane protein HdeD (DUF308 family)
MNQFLPEENKRKTAARFQGYLGVFMGIMYLVIAGAIAYMQVKGLNPDGIFGAGVTMTYVMVVVFIFYGIFRIFRGYKTLKTV